MSNKPRTKPVVKNGKPKAMNTIKDQTQVITHRKLITDMRKRLVTIMTTPTPEETE